MQIRLTPNGNLNAEALDPGTPVALLGEAFQRCWPEGLFVLAAEKWRVNDAPTLSYWQALSGAYLTDLCHLPEDAGDFKVPSPDEAFCAQMVLNAPPMQGAEYLSLEILQGIWNSLDHWVHAAVAQAGGLAAFLEKHAPQWHQVGRVCFHLAENKQDQSRPFAFMATYTAGFGAGGRLRHLPLGKALEQYAGARNRPALINLLSPVQRAAENCPWVEQLVASKAIYRPMAWPTDRAYAFLVSVPELEASGLSVRVPNWWQKRPRPRVSVTIGERKPSGLGINAMLDFDVRVALGDDTLSAAELQKLLNTDQGLVLIKGQWVEVDQEKLGQAIAHWEALRRQAQDGEISFVEGMRLLAGAPADLKEDPEQDVERPWVFVSAGENMRQLLGDLRDPKPLADLESGNGLHTALRPYQHQGLAWLHFLTRLGLGACLADDMGLGKTLQVLALLSCLRRDPTTPAAGPALLVVPASLLGNWKEEALRFTPHLKLLFVHPSESDRETLEKIAQTPEALLPEADLVVTTYAMVSRQKWLVDINWPILILDEAQAVKNPGSRQTKAVKKLSAGARIALTGTPVENRLGDLWSLFDFLNPGLLGSAQRFKTFIKGLESRQYNRFAPLRQLVGPYILRRLKTDRSIISDLPEKTEMACYCTLSKTQVKAYTQTVAALERALDDTDGIQRRGLVLGSIMRLKQICNHPSQLSGDRAYDPGHSGKFQRLAEICEELAQRQEKVLIFTQFREIIDALADHLAGIFGRQGLMLHGGTTVAKRKKIVAQFQDEAGPPFFILSLKAGGTGLNLTAAAHVIHFDRWWNPAVEDQATDRAFRIGQQRNVLVHKFITRGTVEERIDELIKHKRKLADDLLSGQGEVNLTELADEELIQLVRLDVTRAAG